MTGVFTRLERLAFKKLHGDINEMAGQSVKPSILYPKLCDPEQSLRIDFPIAAGLTDFR